jgi:hypothetical protein
MRNQLRLFFLLSVLSRAGLITAQTLTPGTPTLNFGNVYEDAPDSLPLTLTNTLGKPVTVTGIKFYNTYGSPAFAAGSSWFTIPDGDSAIVWITFAPRHNIFHNTEMVVENDGLRGYVSINLLGQGKYSNHYYDPTENLAEENLKASINTITGNGYVSLLYNPARDSMFMWMDNKRTNGQGALQNTIECIYTGREAVGYVDRTDCQNNFSFNTEHTFPQSLFTSLEPMKSDLHHLFPTDNVANNQRGDNPFGTVTSPTWSNGGSLSDGVRFEPRDLQKGQTARAMFYFVLRYQNYNNFLNAQESILRSWHQSHPPDAMERKRNDDIFAIQHNRNPFVDYPVFIERITSLSFNSVAPVLQTIDLPEDTIVYGTVPSGIPAVFEYVIINDGNSDVHFTNFNLSHAPELSFLNSGNDTVLAPGESLTLHIRCLTSLMDSIRAFLTFSSDASGNNFVSVPIFVNDPVFSGVDEVSGDVSVTPNPASDRIVFTLSKFHGGGSLFLYDMTGRCIRTVPLQNSREEIDVSGLSPGVYILHFDLKGFPLTRKLIVAD